MIQSQMDGSIFHYSFHLYNGHEIEDGLNKYKNTLDEAKHLCQEHCDKIFHEMIGV